MIADNFFQGAFGGSFLNHQWLIAAAAPAWAGHVRDAQHSIVDANGMPERELPALHADRPAGSTGPERRSACGARDHRRADLACGDYAVNTIQPTYQPYQPGSRRELPPQTSTTIGDELSAAGVSWAWYSGGWSNADGDDRRARLDATATGRRCSRSELDA